MDNSSRIDEFLKYLAVIENAGEILDGGAIYSILNKYDVDISNKSFDGAPEVENVGLDKNALFYKWRTSLRNDKKLFGFYDGYWFQFRNREGYVEDQKDYIKMYIPLDAEHLEDGVGRIMGFLADEGIYHVSKVGKHIRFDDVVVRLINPEDANRLAEFIKNDTYIQEGLIKADPFAVQKDGIAYACDGAMSYNSVVASLISLYIENERNKTKLYGNDGIDLSFEGFRSFAVDFYNDLVKNPEKQEGLASNFAFSLSFNTRDCMHIIELVCHSMDPSFTYDDYIEFYRNNIYNYNRGYEKLSLPTVTHINNLGESLEFWQAMNKVLYELPTVKEKEQLDLDLIHLEVKRAMMIKELEELDRVIAAKQGKLAAYEDAELLDFNGKIVVSYLNVPALLENIKLIKKNVYADENGFVYETGVVIDSTDDLNINVSAPYPDDISSLSDETTEELLHRCSRYSMSSNWKFLIERDMKEKNISSLQELLEFIRMEKPEEYKLAKSSYEEELVQRRFRQLNIPVDSEDFQPDFENRNMIDVKCRIPYFECGVERTVCPGDIELKIKIGHDYDESVDGPLYSGKLNCEVDRVVSVEGLFTNKDVYANANISFQANIPNYVSGTSYCVRDEETGVIFKFEYNLVKRKVLERDYSEPKGVGREELYVMRMAELMPWTKETSKKETEFNGINDFAMAIPSEKDAAKIDAEEEKIARDKLKHCKLFSSYAEKDGVIDSIISDPNNSVTNARDMVNVIREKEPVIYSEMEAAYAASKKDSVQPVVSMSQR